MLVLDPYAFGVGRFVRIGHDELWDREPVHRPRAKLGFCQRQKPRVVTTPAFDYL